MTLRAFFRRLWAGLLADNVDDVGAMLAFYAVLALFPMLIFIVMITLLALPASAIAQGVEMIGPTMPRSTYQMFEEQVLRMQDATAATGFLIGGAALALWGAS